LELPFEKPVLALNTISPDLLSTNVATTSDFHDHGSIYVFAVNPLSSAGSTAASYINVHLKGGSDMKFFRPDLGQPNPVVKMMVTTYSAESRRIYGEEITTIKQIMNKFTLGLSYAGTPAGVYIYQLNNNAYDPYLSNDFNNSKVITTGFTGWSSLLSWLAMPWVGRTGGQRISFVPTAVFSPEANIVVVPFMNTPAITPIAPLTVPLAVTTPVTTAVTFPGEAYYSVETNATHVTHDVELPIRIPYYYWPTMTNFGINDQNWEFTFKAQQGLNMNVNILFSGADDNAFHMWRGVPMTTIG